MSIKNDKNSSSSSGKSLRFALKEIHKPNSDNTKSYEIDPNKCNKLKKILKNKIQNNYRHDFNEKQRKNVAPIIDMTNDNSSADDEHKTWSCSRCTFANISIMAYCELCSAPKPVNALNNTNHNQDQLMKDVHLAETIMLEQHQQVKEAYKDNEIALKLQKQYDETTKETEVKETEDEEYAKKIQRTLEEDVVIKQKCQKSDELVAMRLQMEDEREMIRLERQRIENERAAIVLHAIEERENAKYLQFKKEQQQAMKLNQEFAMKLQKEQQLEIDEQKVTTLFQKSLHRSRCIISIDDISENDKNEIYEKILSEKVKNSGKSREKIERYLWHGTKNLDNLRLILKNGFDRSYNTNAAFGKGSYFARDSRYSIKGYCGCDSDGVYSILLCKVIVGESTVGNQKVNAIPKKPDGTEYDSLVNDMQNPSIFVIWRDYHACPAYLIKFK